MSSASLGLSRGKLRFHISSFYTRKHFPDIKGGNKYIYLKVDDTDKNRRRAEDILDELKKDLEEGTFNPYDLDRYHIKQYSGGIQQKCLPTVSEICEEQLLYKFKNGHIRESTFADDKQEVNIIKSLKCQDLENIDSVIESLDNIDYALSTKKELLQRINSAIKWGIQKDKFPDIFMSNVAPIEFRLHEIRKTLSRNRPRHKNRRFGEDDLEEYFSKDEMNIVIDAFYTTLKNNSQCNYDGTKHLVNFGFLTGLRTEELYGLNWGDFSYEKVKGESVMKLSVLRAYVSNIKKIQPPKTKNSTRQFLLSPKTQELIERIKPIDSNKNDIVFKAPKGKRLDSTKLGCIWYGTFREDRRYNEYRWRHKDGVVPTLVDKGLIRNYHYPYAMRATFITIKLLEGYPPNMIAKWTGHDVATLIKHYDKLTGLEYRMKD